MTLNWNIWQFNHQWMNKSGCQDFPGFLLLVPHLLNAGSRKLGVCNCFSSSNTWCDFPQHHFFTGFLQPANHLRSVTRHPLKDQHQRAEWSNTGRFDSGNTVTFSSSTSPSLPPFSPPLIHSSRRHAVVFDSCSVSLEQSIWVEEEADKERWKTKTRESRQTDGTSSQITQTNICWIRETLNDSLRVLLCYPSACLVLAQCSCLLH